MFLICWCHSPLRSNLSTSSRRKAVTKEKGFASYIAKSPRFYTILHVIEKQYSHGPLQLCTDSTVLSYLFAQVLAEMRGHRFHVEPRGGLEALR
jgi:hypothetical protein